MAIDKNKVRSVVAALHDEIQQDARTREEFHKNPVKVLATRGLNLEEITDVYDDLQACITITCITISCVALSSIG